MTGASSGIGAATARLLAEQGWHVVAAARRTDRLEELAGSTRGIRAQSLDVTDAGSVAALAAAVPECDLLVANAGGALDADLVEEGDPGTWARTYDVNVTGTVRTVRALLPALRRSKGHVVLTGSTAGRWSYERGGSYVAAKHALVAVREVLRLELVTDGIRVSEVAPGMTFTEEFSLNRYGGDQAKAEAVYAGVEPLTAEDVATCIAFVASLPAHANVDLLQLTPQAQAAAHKVVRAEG